MTDKVETSEENEQSRSAHADTDPGTAAVPRQNVGSATLRDVAEAAGVSVSTVSLVVNQKPNARIGEETRNRVLKAAEQLGYRPNALAKSLVRGGSKFIGLVAQGLATSPFAGSIIRGAQEEAWRHGYVLLVADTDELPEATNDAIEMMRDHQAVGILYSTWHHRSVDPPSGLDHLPTVFVNCFAEGDSRPAVVPDEEQGGRAATNLLLSSGHERIVFINSTEDAPSTVGRLAGFKAALSAAGRTFEDDMVELISPKHGGDFAEAGYEAGRRLMERAEPPTAVFCYNDRTAMGFYDAMKDLGLEIPDDVAVVSFDNQEIIAAHVRPRLTTIALPHYELGVHGVRRLMETITGSDSPSGVLKVECPPVIRMSV